MIIICLMEELVTCVAKVARSDLFVLVVKQRWTETFMHLHMFINISHDCRTWQECVSYV